MLRRAGHAPGGTIDPVRHRVAGRTALLAIDPTRRWVHGGHRGREHPLIAADSLGIPNAWLKVSDKLWGGDFKFHDYYSAFGIADPRPLTLDATTTLDSVLAGLEGYARPGVERAKQALREAFPFPRHWWSRWL